MHRCDRQSCYRNNHSHPFRQITYELKLSKLFQHDILHSKNDWITADHYSQSVIPTPLKTLRLQLLTKHSPYHTQLRALTTPPQTAHQKGMLLREGTESAAERKCNSGGVSFWNTQGNRTSRYITDCTFTDCRAAEWGDRSGVVTRSSFDETVQTLDIITTIRLSVEPVSGGGLLVGAVLSLSLSHLCCV